MVMTSDFEKRLERANMNNFILFFANLGLMAFATISESVENLEIVCVCILFYNVYRHFKLSNVKEGDDF